MTMLTDLQYVADNGTLIEYKDDGKTNSILFSDVIGYWDNANEEKFEGGVSCVINDSQILFTIMVASGQGGVLFIWDVQSRKIVHASNAYFCVAANIYNDKLF